MRFDPVDPWEVHWGPCRLDQADPFDQSWLREKGLEGIRHGHDWEVVRVGVAVAYLVVVRWSWMCVAEVGDLCR